ncbi:MAG TPA: heterodisulfide reductase-related iron-sulfur binding cluster [Candidatus Dormibacteraeota bacterium]|nr:heterodisulfide reductase-related iron-sulfur binding cluster [Candidatus Dormibacteraeota bacterium]
MSGETLDQGSTLSGGTGYLRGIAAPSTQGLNTCTHCGLCLNACPTYRVLGAEMDSPRGRVFMMRQVNEEQMPLSELIAHHLYVCLDCRACETACPSGVPYGSLVEAGRAQVEAAGLTPGRWRLMRWLLNRAILPRPWLTRAVFAFPRWYAGSPLRLLARLLPRGARGWEASLPRPAAPIPVRPQAEAASPPAPHGAAPDAGPKVMALTGCIMEAMMPHLNRATESVLRKAGYTVVAPYDGCCGALNVHAGERQAAKRMAQELIVAFERSGAEYYISNSAGCGAQLKEYAHLFEHDDPWHDRAERFGASVLDISQAVAARGVSSRRTLDATVTYQDACHLAHAQRIRKEPRGLLKECAGAGYRELGDDQCCGSAGVYNLTHPEIANELLRQKLERVEATGARVVVTGNPGCLLHLRRGVAERGMNVDVRHIAEVLDATL